MAGMNSKPSRRITPERKAEAIALCLVQGLPVAEVAKRLGLSRSSLGRWLLEARKAHSDADRISAQVDHLKAAIGEAEERQAALAAQLSILRTETELLSHELSLALGAEH